MKRLALALCLLCPSLAVADCESGSCSVADLVARETVDPAGHQTAVAVPVRIPQTQSQANGCKSQKARRRVFRRCR